MTGLLVHYDEYDVEFEAGLADGGQRAAAPIRPGRRRWARPGGSGRCGEFSWSGVAAQTVEVYQSVT